MGAPKLSFPYGSGGGGGGISGGGTTNRLAMFTGATAVGDSAIAEVAGAIRTLTLTNAGTGATNGTYAQVALTTTTGSGTGATADIVVAGNVVTVLVLRSPGSGYAVGNTLSCASIGGSGFVFTVSAVSASDNASGNLTALRVGVGTTTPRNALDVPSGGAIFQTPTTFVFDNGPFSPGIAQYTAVFGGAAATAVATQSSAGSVRVIEKWDVTGVSNAQIQGAQFTNRLAASTAGQTATFYGVSASATRDYSAGDSATAVTLFGVFSTAQVNQTSGATASQNGVASNTPVFAAGHTVTDLHGFIHRANSQAGTVTNFYGARLQAPTGAGTTTSAWGVAQEWANARNQFAGNVGVGVDPGAGKLIASLTLTNGGTGYTNGTYSQVALTNITGTGTGATADIVVAGGIVTTVVLRSPGQGYVVGNTLSSASIGAGSNFVLTVATVASTIQADGEIIAPRIGAGTTTPRAAVDVVGGAWLNGFTDAAAPLTYSQTTGLLALSRNWATLRVGTETTDMTPVGTTFAYGVESKPQLSNVTGAYVGMNVQPNVISSSGASLQVSGYAFRHMRSTASDLGTMNFSIGFNCLHQAFTGAASAASYTYSTVTGFSYGHNFSAAGTTSTLTAFLSQGFVLAAGHVVTTAYGLRLQASTISGGASITNYYPLTQEDTLGANYVRAKTHFGAAVGTAAATTASIEVTAQGALNGDIRLNSANAVVDVSAAATNGVKFNNRGGAGITSTTQNWYEEGTYTPTLSAGWTATAGNFAGYWTRIGRLVTLTIQFTGGTNSGATGGSTISTPVGLTPVRNGAGSAVNAGGTALGNGVVVVTTAGTIINSNAITSTTVDKTIVVQYEV